MNTLAPNKTAPAATPSPARTTAAISLAPLKKKEKKIGSKKGKTKADSFIYTPCFILTHLYM